MDEWKGGWVSGSWMGSWGKCLPKAGMGLRETICLLSTCCSGLVVSPLLVPSGTLVPTFNEWLPSPPGRQSRQTKEWGLTEDKSWKREELRGSRRGVGTEQFRMKVWESRDHVSSSCSRHVPRPPPTHTHPPPALAPRKFMVTGPAGLRVPLDSRRREPPGEEPLRWPLPARVWPWLSCLFLLRGL